MSFTLTQSYPRLWSLDTGVAMVVTDLHGDWDAYARYRDRFFDLRAAGRADCLIFTGDVQRIERIRNGFHRMAQIDRATEGTEITEQDDQNSLFSVSSVPQLM